jgi:hypothetical protein
MEDLDKVRAQLKAAKLNEVLTRLKVSGTERFFERHPELKKGYAIYMQRRAVRAKVGAPMAPGGTFILGNAAVIAGCMAEAHTMLARLLKLPAENIKLKVERPGTMTGIRLNADVSIPEGYMVPAHNAEDPAVQQQEVAALTEQYLSACLEQINPIFKKDLAERLDAVLQVRDELAQSVIPMPEQTDGEEE